MGDERYGETGSKQSYDNSGILFKNDRKSGDRDPDYKGQCTIAGVGYWMGSWIKDGKSGQKFMSFSFKPKDAPKAATSKPAATQSGGGRDFDDQIPF